jgi:hypothetical protein
MKTVQLAFDFSAAPARKWGRAMLARFVVLASAVTLAAAIPAAALAEAPAAVQFQIRSDCASRWSGDYVMQKWCIGQQLEAYNSLHPAAPEFKPRPKPAWSASAPVAYTVECRFKPLGPMKLIHWKDGWTWLKFGPGNPVLVSVGSGFTSGTTRDGQEFILGADGLELGNRHYKGRCKEPA